MGSWSGDYRPMRYIWLLLLAVPVLAQTHIVTSNINGTCYANSGLPAAVTCAGSSGTIVITNSYPYVMTSNVIIPAGVTTRFEGGAGITTTGFTLTINGPIVAPPVQIFFGTGTVNLGTLINAAPIEWFGAVGGTSTPSTDSTTAIQACFTSLSVGNCIGQGLTYKISSALSIVKSAIGFQGTCGFITSNTLYTAPTNCTQLVSTSASADFIDVTGVSSSNTIAYPFFKGFVMSRSVIPSSTAAGLNLTYTYGAQIDTVMSQDSIYGFYFKGTGSQGTGYIRNSSATWGYNGVSETTGTLNGFYVDSTSGVTNNSLYFENDFVANNVGHGGGSLTTKGFAFNGTALHDFQLHSPQTANTDYGLWMSCNSCSGVLSSVDMTVSNAWFDTSLTSAVYVSGVLGGLMMSNGLYRNNTGTTTPVVDCESSIGVSIVNPQVYQLGTGSSNNYGFQLNSCTGTNIISPIIGNTANSAINLAGSAKTNIIGIQASCTGCTSVVNIGTSTNTAFASGQINGTATNGIAIDGTSTVAGLDSVSITGPTTLINDSNTVNFASLNGIGIVHSTSGVLLCSAKAPTFSSGFNTGSITQQNGSCAFSVTVGSGSAVNTGVISLPTAAHGWNCPAPFNVTHTGNIIIETANSTTSATFINYGTTPGTPVNWTNGDVIGFTCFAD